MAETIQRARACACKMAGVKTAQNKANQAKCNKPKLCRTDARISVWKIKGVQKFSYVAFTIL